MKIEAKCIRGPYWLPDEDPYAEEHFGYDCLLNGNKVIVGEEPDGFRYMHEWDGQSHNLWKGRRSEIMSELGKAIKAHELKQSVSLKTAKTLRDLIDEL